MEVVARQRYRCLTLNHHGLRHIERKWCRSHDEWVHGVEVHVEYRLILGSLAYYEGLRVASLVGVPIYPLNAVVPRCLE